MSIYSIEFKPLSVLTKIPDAQTIFGAFCYKMKEIYGENTLKNFLKLENGDNPLFLISSMFYNQTMPIPLDFMPIKENVSSLEDASQNKKVKKIKYMSKSLFIEYKNNKEKFMKDFYKNLNDKFIIVNNELLLKKDENIINDKYIVKDVRTRNAYSNSLTNKKLYKDEVIYCNEKLTFNIYINILNEKCADIVLNIFKSMNYVFFGGHKSIGYNLFSFIDCKTEKELENTNHKTLVSKSLITQEIDLENSFYKFQVLNNKNNQQLGNIYHKQVYVLDEGSVISTSKEYIGRMVEEKVNEKTIYQYYLGMLL